MVLACDKMRDMDLELSCCRARERQLQDSALGEPVIKNTYHEESLLLFCVFMFRQKGGTRNFGYLDLYKFSSRSTDDIKQI